MATAAAAAARGAAADLADSRVQPTASHSSPPIIRRADWEALAHAVFACGSSSLVNYVNYVFACGSSSLVNYVNYVNYVFACGSSSLVNYVNYVFACGSSSLVNYVNYVNYVFACGSSSLNSIRGDGRTSHSVPAPHYRSGAVTRAASGDRMRWYVRREAHAAGSARSGDAARPGEHRRRVVRRRSAEGVKYQRGVHGMVRGVRCERRRSSSGWLGPLPSSSPFPPNCNPQRCDICPGTTSEATARVTSMAGPSAQREN
jgi:hypothetical protein